MTTLSELIAAQLKMVATEVADASSHLTAGFSVNGFEDIVTDALTAMIPNLVNSVLTTFGVSTLTTSAIELILDNQIADLCADALNDFGFTAVIDSVISSAFSSSVVLTPMFELAKDYIYSDLIDGAIDYVMNFLESRLQQYGVIEIPISQFATIAISWDISLTTFINEAVTFKPFLWLSNSLNMIMGWVESGIEDLVDDLPKPLIIAMPWTRIAVKLVDEYGTVNLPSIPDFNLELHPVTFNVGKIKFALRWEIPDWKDIDITGSEGWNYLIDGIYNTGSSFDPIKKVTWGELIICILTIALLIYIVKYISTALGGKSEIPKAILTRAIQSASMSNLQSNFKVLSDELATIKSTTSSISSILATVKTLTESIPTTVYSDSMVQGKLNQVISQCEEILVKMGLRFLFQ